jgi:hypothetical protein
LKGEALRPRQWISVGLLLVGLTGCSRSGSLKLQPDLISPEKLQAVLPDVFEGSSKSDMGGEIGSFSMEDGTGEGKESHASARYSFQVSGTWKSITATVVDCARCVSAVSSAARLQITHGRAKATTIGGRTGFEQWPPDYNEGTLVIIVQDRLYLELKAGDPQGPSKGSELLRKFAESVDWNRLLT